MATSKEDWAQSCREFRDVGGSSADLYVYTIGAIRSVTRDERGSLNEVRALLDGLAEALSDQR